jgi:uncharacterized protein (TIGR00251 family)
VSEAIVQERGGAVRFTVRVQPRAPRSKVDGVHAGALRVRLAAPPVDGAANEELIALLAEQLRVPKRAISIVSGGTSRTKLIQIEGVTVAGVQALAAQR